MNIKLLREILQKMSTQIMPPPHPQDQTILDHGLEVAAQLPKYLYIPAVLHDMGMTKEVKGHAHHGYEMALELGLSERNCNLIRYHMGIHNLANLIDPTKKAVRRFVNKHKDYLSDLIGLSLADCLDLGDIELEEDVIQLMEAVMLESEIALKKEIKVIRCQ